MSSVPLGEIVSDLRRSQVPDVLVCLVWLNLIMFYHSCILLYLLKPIASNLLYVLYFMKKQSIVYSFVTIVKYNG